MTAREWLEKARREKFAIGAFNVGNLETFKAIVQAAVSQKSPVIIESSPGETAWMEAENIVDLARNYSEEYGIPILVNLDHAESLEQCIEGIKAGYDLIHFDGSKFILEDNLEIAKKLLKIFNLDESYIKYVKDRAGHDRRYAIDSTKIRELGWKPKISFKELVRGMVHSDLVHHK